MTALVHVLEVGNKKIELNPSEAHTIIRGDVPKRLATVLAERGIVLPPRGTMLYHLERRENGLVVFRSEAHCRRVA